MSFFSPLVGFALTATRRQIDTVDSPSDLYATLMELIVRLAKDGLIHGDFNEFNILIKRKDGQPVVIDFPQMVSTRHANAELWVSSTYFVIPAD